MAVLSAIFCLVLGVDGGGLRAASLRLAREAEAGVSAAVATAENSTTWPRDAEITDASLRHTFRGDDFLPGTPSLHWVSRPRVNECPWPSPEPLGEEPDCDKIALGFRVITPRSVHEPRPKRYSARDYVQPLPDADLLARLREGPLRDLVQQRLGTGPVRVTFVVHGYVAVTASGPGLWQVRLGKELVSGSPGDEDAVLAVEWVRGAHATWHDCHGFECVDDYSVAMVDTRVVGKYLQRLAAGIEAVVGDHVRFGCIGHSLGSHACGFMGKYVQLEGRPAQRLSRISALDPAGPSHSLLATMHKYIGGRSWVDAGYAHARLDRSDAEFVDAYISDPGGLGYDYALAAAKDGRENVQNSDLLGHVNFFVNGELYDKQDGMQPGCGDELLKKGCSHHVAIEEYINSIVKRNAAGLNRTASETGADMVLDVSDPGRQRIPFALFAMAVLIVACLSGLAASGTLGRLRGAEIFSSKTRVGMGVIFTVAICIILFVTVAQTSPSVVRPLLRRVQELVVTDSHDYCMGFEGTPGKIPARKCMLPFSAKDSTVEYATDAGSTCPTWSPVQNATFGICATLSNSWSGLYMAAMPDAAAGTSGWGAEH